MALYSKAFLSGSTNGKCIKVVATSIGSGTTIHTAQSGTIVFDEIWLWVTNTFTSVETLTVGWGGTTDPDDLICKALSIPASSPPIPICMGLLLNNSLVVKASASNANRLLISGYVNLIV